MSGWEVTTGGWTGAGGLAVPCDCAWGESPAESGTGLLPGSAVDESFTVGAGLLSLAGGAAGGDV
jgi:hypothetical protein